MDFTADGRDRYRGLQLIDFTTDGRDRHRTLQHMDFTVDGRDRLKTSLLRILKILVFCRLSQLDANAARLQFFSTLPLSRAVAVVAV